MPKKLITTFECDLCGRRVSTTCSNPNAHVVIPDSWHSFYVNVPIEPEEDDSEEEETEKFLCASCADSVREAVKILQPAKKPVKKSLPRDDDDEGDY